MPHSPYSNSDADHYCRLFRPGITPPDPENTPAVRRFANSLFELVKLMNHDGEPEHQAPAKNLKGTGYTYFGQLIDHDLTQDGTKLKDAWKLEPKQIKNFSSAKLDLDNIYGDEPGANNGFYNYLYEEDKLHLKVTSAAMGGDSFDLAVGLTKPLKTGEAPSLPLPGDPPLPPKELYPLLADPRSTENLILRQMIALFARLHNVAVDELRGELHSGKLSREECFRRARCKTQWTYQWLIVKDYLPTMLDSHVYDAVFNKNDRKFEWKTFSVPIEFAVAAMRFGHSMVRGNYDLNPGRREIGLEEILARSNKPGVLDEEDWKIDWGNFFQNAGIAHQTRTHRPIDTQITSALHSLHSSTILKFRTVLTADLAEDHLTELQDDPFAPNALPQLTLMRGAGLRLASGQTAAKAFGIKPLTDHQLTQEGDPDQGAYLRQPDNKQLLHETPLWYYILKESELPPYNGNRLGPTGSRIVAETIYAALKHDPNSILNHPAGCSMPPMWHLRSGNVIFLRLSQLFAEAYGLVAA